MASQAKLNEVDKLLNKQYGIGLSDVGEDAVERALDDDEDPQAIVDWLAEKHGLDKIEPNERWEPSLN